MRHDLTHCGKGRIAISSCEDKFSKIPVDRLVRQNDFTSLACATVIQVEKRATLTVQTGPSGKAGYTNTSKSVHEIERKISQKQTCRVKRQAQIAISWRRHRPSLEVEGDLQP